jgi:hypothetical protein
MKVVKGLIIVALAVSIAIILVAAALWPSGESSSPEATVTFGPHSYSCEVADTAAERSLGLMYRETLAADSGMLFVFDSPQNVSFWMKNTLIPLDIVFIGEDGTIVNIAQADPEPGVADSDLTRYPSASPVKWVLELNRGQCAQNGIVAGSAASIIFN